MRRIFLAIACLFIVQVCFGATSFCITVNDVCCNAGTTTGSHQLVNAEDFAKYYIYYDAGSEANSLTIKCYHDGFLVWTKVVCGCGTELVEYPTAHDHLIEIQVLCNWCGSMPPCYQATSTVKVYTPASNGCLTNCPSQ